MKEKTYNRPNDPAWTPDIAYEIAEALMAPLMDRAIVRFEDEEDESKKNYPVCGGAIKQKISEVIVDEEA